MMPDIVAGFGGWSRADCANQDEEMTGMSDFWWWTGSSWELRSAVSGQLPNPGQGPGRFTDEVLAQMAAEPLAALPAPPERGVRRESF
jgi:hypothetical protein